MKWTFTVDKNPHEAEWQKGAMRCTMPEVIGRVDEIIYAGGLVPCGSAVNLVEPTLETEAGGFAAITLAIQEFADFMSLKMPLSEATVITDVIFDDDLEKAKSFDGDRSAAARYAAFVRWGNRGKETALVTDGDPIYDSTVVLTPEQEAIAAQAEGAVVDQIEVSGGTTTEEQVNALIAAGFKGDGEPPKKPEELYVSEADDLMMSAIPDYMLLPKEFQTPELIESQESLFTDVQVLATQYKNGEMGYGDFRLAVAARWGNPAWSKKEGDRDEVLNAQAVARQNKFEMSGKHNMTRFPQNIEDLGVNPKTGKSYQLEQQYDKKNAGKIVAVGEGSGRIYYPSREALLERDTRIRTMHTSQGKAKADTAAYELAVDKWMGIKPSDYGSGDRTDRKAHNPRNHKVAQVLGDAYGFHRGAQQVSGDNFNALARSGRFYVVWRGDSKKGIDSLATTRPHMGGGEQGIGTYTTYIKSRATSYGGTPTPMLIPKTAVRRGRTEFDAWGSPYSDDFTYRTRRNLSHGESDERESGDFKVANLSMLIIGPRDHSTPFIENGAYRNWVDTVKGGWNE